MIERQTDSTLRRAPFVSLCSLYCRHPCCCVSLRLAVCPAEPGRNRTSLSNQRGKLCWVLVDHQMEKPLWKATASAGPFRTAFSSLAALHCFLNSAFCYFVSLAIPFATLFLYLSSLLLPFLICPLC